METLAIATAYTAYETAHNIQSRNPDFSEFKLSINSRWLSYLGVIFLSGQIVLNHGAIATAQVFSQPIRNAVVNTRSSCLNVRVAPNGDKVNCLAKGTTLREIVREDNGWYQLANGYWVSKQYVAVPATPVAVVAPAPVTPVAAAPAFTPNPAAPLTTLQYVEGDLMQGQEVRTLQVRLNDFSLLNRPIQVDGVFGRETKLAVMSFQEKRGLAMDGIVGTETANALRR